MEKWRPAVGCAGEAKKSVEILFAEEQQLFRVGRHRAQAGVLLGSDAHGGEYLPHLVGAAVQPVHAVRAFQEERVESLGMGRHVEGHLPVHLIALHRLEKRVHGVEHMA